MSARHTYHYFRNDVSACGLLRLGDDVEVACPLDLICDACKRSHQRIAPLQVQFLSGATIVEMVYPLDRILMRTEQ